MNVRRFRETDTQFLVELFRKTVHTICRKDYSQDQFDAWAPAEIDLEKWTDRFTASFTVLAENEQQITGFANLGVEGHIDMFYVAADFQLQGVGSQLLETIVREAKRQGIVKIHSDVSLTARSFFLSKGFFVVKEYSKSVGAELFRNAIVAKTIT